MFNVFWSSFCCLSCLLSFPFSCDFENSSVLRVRWFVFSFVYMMWNALQGSPGIDQKSVYLLGWSTEQGLAACSFPIWHISLSWPASVASAEVADLTVTANIRCTLFSGCASHKGSSLRKSGHVYVGNGIFFPEVTNIFHWWFLAGLHPFYRSLSVTVSGDAKFMNCDFHKLFFLGFTSDTEDASETDLAKHDEEDYVEMKEQWVWIFYFLFGIQNWPGNLYSDVEYGFDHRASKDCVCVRTCACAISPFKFVIFNQSSC